jgi:CBS domain-containing protein
VISVAPSTPIHDAAALMLARRFSAVPVVDDQDVLVGIVSEGDLLRRRELRTECQRPRWLEFFLTPAQLAEEYTRSRGRFVRDVMTDGVVTIQPEATLQEAVEVMTRHRIKRLPVLKDGRLVGIISRSDVLGALARTVPAKDPVAVDDETIRSAILSEIAGQDWGRVANVCVAVDSGVVTLSGTVRGKHESLAACVAAENTPGVKAVVDQLKWLACKSGERVPGPEQSRRR